MERRSIAKVNLRKIRREIGKVEDLEVVEVWGTGGPEVLGSLMAKTSCFSEERLRGFNRKRK